MENSSEKNPEKHHPMPRQRRIILEELQRARSHPSADELHEMIRQKLPRVSIGTIYRNLEILTRMNLIQTLELVGTQRRYDGNPEPHYHIRCIRCDRLDDAPMDTIPEFEATLDSKNGYRIIGHRLEFIGLCQNCSDKITDQPGKKALLI